MTILTAADSTMERMETRLAARLGVPVEDGSVGGDRVGDVLARTQRIGRGKQLIIRCGHNVELRQGQFDIILNAIRQIAALGSDYVVLELGMVSDIAIPQSDLARTQLGFRNEVCRRLAEEHGDRYVPIHQMLLAQARKQPLLSATDLRWIDAGMLPQRWWAPFGTNGHYADEARDVAADVLTPVLRWRFLGGPAPDDTTAPPVIEPLPPVVPPVKPLPPIEPPPMPPPLPQPMLERVRDWIRRFRSRSG